MRKFEIYINGEAYPCIPTMGAMLRFKEETGREVSELNAASLSDICTYLYCCVVSACKREGKPFDLSLMDFADSISPEDMQRWNEGLSEGVKADEEQKKSPQAQPSS